MCFCLYRWARMYEHRNKLFTLNFYLPLCSQVQTHARYRRTCPSGAVRHVSERARELPALHTVFMHDHLPPYIPVIHTRLGFY